MQILLHWEFINPGARLKITIRPSDSSAKGDITAKNILISYKQIDSDWKKEIIENKNKKLWNNKKHLVFFVGSYCGKWYHITHSLLKWNFLWFLFFTTIHLYIIICIELNISNKNGIWKFWQHKLLYGVQSRIHVLKKIDSIINEQFFCEKHTLMKLN